MNNTRNRILAALPADERERLAPELERVELGLREVLVEPHQTISHVYFVEEGVVSILSLMADGSAIETATVGNEGMVGVPVFLGAMQMAGQAFVQVPGHGLRMRAGALRDEVRRGGMLAELLGRYTQALFTLVAQASACNRKHPVDARCARWLLLTHDRVQGDRFDLTHHFLSQMLGVRRATVTEAMDRLRGNGAVDYRRGRVTIRDRAVLEAVSCECYEVVRAEFARLLDGVERPSPLDGLVVSRDGLATTGDGTPAGAEGEMEDDVPGLEYEGSSAREFGSSD